MADELDSAAREPVSHRAVPDRPAPPPSRRSILVATVFGFLAWGSGLAIIGMSLWALFC